MKAQIKNYNLTVLTGLLALYMHCSPVMASEALTITEPTFTSPTCAGLSNATMTFAVFGGTPDYTVTATQLTTPFQTVTQSATDLVPVVLTGLLPGTWTISVRDSVGGTANLGFSFVIPDADPILIGSVFITQPACTGGLGSVVVTVTGGTGIYTVTATPASTGQSAVHVAGTNEAPITIPDLLAGDYTLSVVDTNGCTTLNVPITVSEPSPLQIVVTSTNETCPGLADGSIAIAVVFDSGTPPYLFSIFNGAPDSFGPNSVFNNLPAGAYTVVAMDNNGCTTTAVAVINPATPIGITTQAAAPTCPGGANGQITVTATGTPPLLYGLAPTPIFTSNNVISNLTSGNYQVIVQDGNGCQAFSDVVTVPAATPFFIQSVIITPISCAGTDDATITVNVEGLFPPFFYSIDGGTSSTGNFFEGVAPGVHVITVTDAHNCTLTYTTQNILDPSPLLLTPIAVPALCFGQANGKIFLTPSGGTPPYLYSIDGGITFSVANQFTGLAANAYDVVIQDSRGCILTTTVTVTQPLPVKITNVLVNNVSCSGGFNGSITISVQGGVGKYLFSIDGGNTFIANNTFTGLKAGPYFIVVKDANGCTAKTSVVVSQPEQLSVAGVTTVTTNACTCAATVTVLPAGGTPPFMISINGGAFFRSTNVFTNVLPGTLSIVIKDANGCTATANAVVRCPSM